ncbi:MAG: T9SS type A sorting domain-containing protein [Candidatus Latescibacteria bacterium]|nr:T9SS type A sorting domain-containing protein [Candidatus Latescibacterota bacterium]
MIKKIVLCSIIICCSAAMAITYNEFERLVQLEQLGVETSYNPMHNSNALTTPRPTVNRLGGVLMNPVAGESLGLFDPYNGDYLGSLCYIGTGTPINAVQGPHNMIYVSYQVGDKVEMFDTTGTYIGPYATSANGLDNTRGIDFYNGHCFITNGSSGTKTIEMSAPNTVHRIFIQDGSDPFDIHFLPNGKSLLADIAGTTDNVRIYDTNGVYIRNIFSINFPEQIQDDPAYSNRFMVAGFSTNNIQLFDTTGVVYRTYALSGARGVYRLGNGNILGTNGTATYMIDSATGTQTIKRSGQGRFIELYRPPVMLVDTISATAFGPGTIVPSGTILVNRGSDTTFTMTPNTNCQLDSLVVDNVNHGGDSTTYRFTNVTTNHTIKAYFSTMVGYEEIREGRFIQLGTIQPNPFKNLVTIKYNLNQAGMVSVKIYNCLGREVRTLVNQHQTSGVYSLNWNGKDHHGSSVANGIYMIRITTQNQTEQRQLILVK